MQAGSPLSAAFNKRDLSDVTVAICVTDVDDVDDRASEVKRQRTSGGTASPVRLVLQEVHAHQVVLTCCSEDFARRLGHLPAGTPAAPVRLDLPLSSAKWVTYARRMLEFMYTQNLHVFEGRVRNPSLPATFDTMHLLKLGYLYKVPTLRKACLEHLAKQPLDGWHPVAYKNWLPSLLPFVSKDKGVPGELGAAATALLDAVKAHMHNLEVFWQDSNNRELFGALPACAVLEVLGDNSLVVRSEDTVLVAALSWLRSSGGQVATRDMRKQALASVRLLQLSTWFHLWLLSSAPEARELLEPATIADMRMYGVLKTKAQRQALTGKAEQLAAWAAPRAGHQPAMPAKVEVSRWMAFVQHAVQELRTGKQLSCETAKGREVHWAGLAHCASIVVRASEEGVEVFGGVARQLVVAGKVVAPEPGFCRVPIDVRLTLGTVRHRMTCPVGYQLGEAAGYTHLIKPGDDLEAELPPLSSGGSMELTAVIGASTVV